MHAALYTLFSAQDKGHEVYTHLQEAWTQRMEIVTPGVWRSNEEPRGLAPMERQGSNHCSTTAKATTISLLKMELYRGKIT